MYPDHVYDNVVIQEEELMPEAKLGRFRITYNLMKMVSVWASTEDEATQLIMSDYDSLAGTAIEIGGPDILDIEEIVNSD
jgi:hypothetical protein